jgi:phosphatidylglycerophosphate synthase
MSDNQIPNQIKNPIPQSIAEESVLVPLRVQEEAQILVKPKIVQNPGVIVEEESTQVESNGKKLLPEHQDVIDYQLDKLVVILNPIFKSINFTPNHITTLSLIFGLITLYLLWKKHCVLAGLSYFVSYFFDCQDGNYARTYKMYSDFGSLYDHISDAVIIIGLICIYILKDYDNKFRYGLLAGGVVIGYLCWQYYLKQEEYYDATANKTESKVDMKPMRYLKYFGPGSAAFIITLVIMTSGFFEKDTN